MESFHLIANIVFLADLSIRLGLAVRVVMRRLPVGVSLAWLTIILVFPFAGAVLYLLLGEYRLGPRRAARAAAYRKSFSERSSTWQETDRVELAKLYPDCPALARLARSLLDIE